MGQSRRPHPQQTATKVLGRSERDRLIIGMKRRGVPTREIAEAADCNPSTVTDVVKRAVTEAAAERFTEAELLVTERLEQYGALLDAVWDGAMAGNLKAVAAATRILGQISDLTGEKAPIRHEFGESDVDRAIRELGEVLNRRVAAAAGQVPDAARSPDAGEDAFGH
jgi:AcrR family transcriptional regulator